MDRRIVASALLGLAFIAMMQFALPDAAPVPAMATASLRVDGPDGVIWDGTVQAQPGSAFHALLDGAERGGFVVEWSRSLGSVYVSSIAGHGDAGGGGWCVQVNGADSPRSVDRFPVQDGQHVRWYWTDGQCDRF